MRVGVPGIIDSGDAPVFQVDGLYDVEVDGPDCWFQLFEYRRTPGGLIVQAPAFWIRMPTEAVGPGIALTWRKVGAAMIVPAIAQATGLVLSTRVH